MNEKNFSLAKSLVVPGYISQGHEARRRREKQIRTLLSNRSLPEKGWDDLSITLLLKELSVMDTNNFLGNVGVGEREGRIFSDLIRKRHYNLAHGIGRSGDVNAIQPKAAGSSLLLKICTFLTLHALKLAGIKETRSVLLVPTATGMAHVLALLTLRKQYPHATKVIWPRMDQKTCLKSIITAGLTPLIVDNLLEGDEVRTNVAKIEELLQQHGDDVLCVLSTNSCFAPRVPDRIIEISKLCQKYDRAHIINNAYGVQCASTCKAIDSAYRRGRVDCFIQSTDKNFMVPVGGAIIGGFDESFIDSLSKTYPGRASMSPILDLCVTLLSMGKKGWLDLLQKREKLTVYFRKQLAVAAENLGERLLHIPNNPISMAITLDTFRTQEDIVKEAELDSMKEETSSRQHSASSSSSSSSQGRRFTSLSYLGAILFNRNISGPRTVPRGVKKEISGINFIGYGASIDTFPHPYVTAACAIGMTKEDIDTFIERLSRSVKEYRKQKKKMEKLQSVPPTKTTMEKERTTETAETTTEISGSKTTLNSSLEKLNIRPQKHQE